MRDLKHLIYFENLLQQANNDLVQDACKDGRLALAWNCSYIPEVLLDTDNCFGVRLRAPNCTNPDMATYYMTNRSCPYSKSILERAFEGGYNFISALIGQECCTTMNRMEQYFEYCELIPNEKFFCTYLDMPLRKTEWHAGYYRRQIEQKIIQPLEKVYGVDFSEEKLRKAVEQFNEVCRIITEMNAMRMADNPVITGYEFHVIQLCTLTCPKDLILPYLRETLQELRERKPDPKPWYRARVLIAGSEIDDPEFTKMLEMAGGMVVAATASARCPAARRSRSRRARTFCSPSPITICGATSARAPWAPRTSSRARNTSSISRRNTAPTASSSRT